MMPTPSSQIAPETVDDTLGLEAPGSERTGRFDCGSVQSGRRRCHEATRSLTTCKYYPNMRSLLFAMFQDHTEKVSRGVEIACEDACHKPMSEMLRQVMEAYVDAKMQRADISVACTK